MGRTISNTGTAASNVLIGNDAINLTSTAGFTAGDYVYQNNGDFLGAPGSPAGATISAPTTVGLPGRLNAVEVPAADSTIAAVGQSLYTSNTAAKLSNGNIVLAYLGGATSNLGYPYFKIIDETNATVVAATQIEATAARTICQIGVVALSGGGFAVVWGTTTPQIRYAVYSNTGTVVTAPTTDAGVNLSASIFRLSLAARPTNGGFVIGVIASAGAATYRVYGSTGTALYAWTTLVASAQDISVTCRSDDTLVVLARDSGNINWYVYSSTNTLVTSSSFANSFTSLISSCLSSATLTNDTVVFTYPTNPSSTYSLSYVFLPTTNVLGSATVFVALSANAKVARVASLANGNFVLFCSLNTGSAVNQSYFVYTSAGALVTTGNSGIYSFSGISPNYAYAFGSIVETTTYIAFFACAGYKTGPAYATPGPNTVNMYRVVKAGATGYTYTPLLNSTSITTAGTNATVAATTYIPASSGPVAATYSSTAIGNTAYTEAASSGSGSIVSAVTIDSVNTASTVASTTLPNGNFVIVYRYAASPYTVRMAVYTPAGVAVNSYTVGNNVSSHLYNIRVVALDNGKVAVAYASAASTISLVIYSSVFAVVTTVSITAGLGTAGFDFDIAALTSNRIIAVYKNSASNTSQYSVYDDTGAALVAPASLNASNWFNNSVAADQSGGFYYAAAAAVNGAYVSFYYAPSGTNTWTANTITNTNAFALFSPAIKPAVSSDGSNNLSECDPAATIQYNAIVFGKQGSSVTGANTGNVLGTTASVASGVDGYGYAVSMYASSSTNISTYYISGFTTGTPVSSNFVLTVSGMTTTTTNGNTLAITPSVGHRVCVAYLSSSFPTFYVVNLASYTTYGYTTSGVGTGTYNLVPSNGYSLAGIAMSTATAGGSGIVQVNGQAQLGSSYQSQATAAPFDSTSLNSFGTKGAVLGRTVSMQRGV